MVTFGHKDSGKTFTCFGENNYQLQRNVTDPAETSDDSRGLVLRCINDIRKKDPEAEITASYIDVVLDNIRDLAKYIQRERK